MTVHLVGAGPGDPELLTMRAASLLHRADVVVHDRLVDRRTLAMAPPWAERIDVGKRPGSAPVGQEAIHAILVDRARRHDTVVRLKGGDPFVFGRGGEEACALRAAGIEVDEVPGLTSAVAAPAAAGIPLTMRGLSSGFTVVTARQAAGDPETLDWRSLAHTGTTLVILMGAARKDQICDRLVAAGMAPDTPVAVVTSASSPAGTVDRTTLAGLSHLAVRSPATIVVGAVAAIDVLGPAHDSEIPTPAAHGDQS
ncbi:MAG: uroporphyrinogen-III C-methyltransferase [Acidimicrobiales bacterium]